MGQMKTTNDKLFKLTLVTQVDPSRPAHEQTETIKAFDLRAAHEIAAKLFPDVSRLGSIRVKEMPEMPEMVSIDKAFGDFAKACDKAVGKCQDFIDMDVTGKADTRQPFYADAKAEFGPTHKPKIVPIKPPTQKELDNSTSKGTRVLTYEESMER